MADCDGFAEDLNLVADACFDDGAAEDVALATEDMDSTTLLASATEDELGVAAAIGVTVTTCADEEPESKSAARNLDRFFRKFEGISPPVYSAAIDVPASKTTEKARTF